MRQKRSPLFFTSCLMAVCAFSVAERSFAAFADMSDWVAINNTAGLNDYSLTSATSAGGTFADRRLDAASLSDHSLVGGPFDWHSPLSMSGTVTFSNAFDPVMFVGWYNSNNLNERVGLGLANPVPAGTGIRWQTQSGNLAADNYVSQTFASNAASTFAPGTYDFTFEYDGAGHMSGTFGSMNFAKNYAQPTNTALNLDRFGLLQKSGADDDVNSYTFSISDINYTGQTLVPEPSSLVLLLLGCAFLARVRR